MKNKPKIELPINSDTSIKINQPKTYYLVGYYVITNNGNMIDSIVVDNEFPSKEFIQTQIDFIYPQIIRLRILAITKMTETEFKTFNSIK